MNCSPLNTNAESLIQSLSKAKWKNALQTLQTSKKLEDIDNPVIAEDAQITGLQDQWLVKRDKATLKTKVRMKKVAITEKKLAEKLEKAHEKARSKNQSLNIRKLAINNNNAGEVDTFKDVLSGPLISNPDDQMHSHEEYTEPIFLEALAIAKLKNVEKKKAKNQALTKRLSLEGNSMRKIPRAHRTPTPPHVIMELIRPGKQKVKVLANVVKNTPSK